MLAASRPWRRREAPGDVIAELEHDFRMSPLAARLMALRGITTADADRFLSRRLADLHRPELMTGMELAAERLAEAITARRTILIHGDYDVDGTTASALLAGFVEACAHRAIAWIPHRRIDGYGLSEASLEAARTHHADLLITVDCGIADHGWAERIEQAGTTVIVTDHHLKPDNVSGPRCTAVVNPNQPGCPYPDKGLAGVGVAWKLAWATAKRLSGSDKVSPRLREYLLDSLALVAVGTLADCAPLTGENRVLVHHGLGALRRTSVPGLRALIEHARLDEDLSASDVGWKISPLLNASGRVGSAMGTLALLTAADAEAARTALAAVVSENEERRRLTQLLTADLIAAAARPEHAGRCALVFAGDGWHAGVVGIVASRLVETYQKPAAVIALADGVGKGSLRSIAGVNLGECLAACRPYLLKGGGHAMAAGLSIDPAQVPAFADAFEAAVRERLPGGGISPRTDYDADVAMGELDGEFFAVLDRLGPFGNGNPEPMVQVSGVSIVARPRLFGANADHLKAAITDAGGGMRELLCWRGKDLFTPFATGGARFDLLVRPQATTFRGQPQTRLVWVDGRSAQ